MKFYNSKGHITTIHCSNQCITINSEFFNIKKISESGQCFRINPTVFIDTDDYEPSSLYYNVIAYDHRLYMEQKCDRKVVLYCSEYDFNNIWKHYFDLESLVDTGFEKKDLYQEVEDLISDSQDEFLIKCAEYSRGIRILNQNPWETLLSFILSQQNNIPRIKKMIENLCNDKPNYHFPTPYDILCLSDERLNKLGLGYRKDYIVETSKFINLELIDLLELRLLDTNQIIDILKKLPGVGDKIANCVALFAYHKLDAFPIDVWIKRVIDKVYGGHLILPNYLIPYKGIVQQYMYYYSLNHKEEFK